MRRLLLAFGLPPALHGLTWLGFGCYATYEHLAFSRNRFRHLPVVEFVTASGQRVRFESQFGGDPPLRVGDQVAVLYPPSRPGQSGSLPSGSRGARRSATGSVAGGAVALVVSAPMVALRLRLRR